MPNYSTAARKAGLLEWSAWFLSLPANVRLDQC